MTKLRSLHSAAIQFPQTIAISLGTSVLQRGHLNCSEFGSSVCIQYNAWKRKSSKNWGWGRYSNMYKLSSFLAVQISNFWNPELWQSTQTENPVHYLYSWALPPLRPPCVHLTSFTHPLTWRMSPGLSCFSLLFHLYWTWTEEQKNRGGLGTRLVFAYFLCYYARCVKSTLSLPKTLPRISMLPCHTHTHIMVCWNI